MSPNNKKETVLTKKHVARLERERRQSLIIRWVAISVVVFVVVGGLISAFLDGTLSIGKFNIDYALRNRPVAQLGDKKVTLREFQGFVQLQRQQLLMQYATYSQYQQFGLDVSSQLQQIEAQLGKDNAEAFGQQVVDALVNDLLIRQEAEKRGITVSDEEIQSRIEGIFDYYPKGTPTPSATPTEIIYPTLSEEQLKLVTATPTITLTPDGTLQPTVTASPTLTLTPDLTQTATITVTAVPSDTPTPEPTATSTPTEAPTETPGPTSTPEPTATPYTQQGFEDTFKQSMEQYAKLGMTEDDYRNLVISDLLRTKLMEVITADVKPVEEQVWARHILVADQATALAIREKLSRGEDFAALAAEYSTDTSNKDSGGDLGWFSKNTMVAEFETAAWALKVGEISEPVQTQFGWHIIQVLGHEERPISASDLEQRKQEAFNNWLAEARKKVEDDGTLKLFDIWKNYIPLTPSLDDLLQQAQ